MVDVDNRPYCDDDIIVKYEAQDGELGYMELEFFARHTSACY
jgi:hypothetical protein